MKRYLAGLLGALLCATVQAEPATAAPAATGGADSLVYAVADIRPFPGQTASGTATFVQDRTGKVHVVVRARGLTNPLHGIHIHTVGDCSAPAAPGGHFDPVGGRPHGYPQSKASHAGDMVNIRVDQNGVGTMAMQKGDITLSPGKNSVMGRAVIIHAGEDQFTPEAMGGDRIACGVITQVK